MFLVMIIWFPFTCDIVSSQPRVFPGKSFVPQGRATSKSQSAPLNISKRPKCLYEPSLSKSKEFNNRMMEIQVNRFLLKAFFCHQKISTKANTLHEVFFNPWYKCATGTSIHYFKISTPFVLLPLLFQIIFYFPNKPTCCWLPQQSFGINLNDKSSHISIDPKGLYHTPEFLFDFISKLYISLVSEIFQNLVCLDCQKNIFASQQIFIHVLLLYHDRH